MSLSFQLRRRSLSVFSGICVGVLIGCGGGSEPAISDASQADDAAATDSTAMPGMGSDPGGAGGHGGADTMPGMSSSPDMGGSMPGGGGGSGSGSPAPMASAPGMGGSMPGGGGGHGAGMAMATGGGESSSGNPEEYSGGSGYPGASSGYPGGQVAAKPSRPGNFDAWTDEDFMSAAREHDPKILDAIDFKVKSAPGDASVAVLLIGLLDLPPLPNLTNPNGGAAGYPSGNPGMPDGEMPSPGSSNLNPASAPGSAVGHGAAPGALSAPERSISPQAFRSKESNQFDENIVACSGAAVDSVSAMILEASVTYMPQGAAVGAIAGGVQGRMEGLAGHAAEGSSTPPGSGPQGYVPPGENSGSSMPPGDPGGYPGNGYPGNGYPGGNLGGNLGGNPQDPNGAPGSGQLQDRMLVEKVVDGLIVNNSKDAWQAIFGIVAGTVKTPLPAVSNCEVVVERLIQNMDSNADVIQPVILAFLDSATPIPPESRTACVRMLAAISATQTETLTGFAMTAAPAAAGPGAANGYSGMQGGESSFPGMSGAEGYPEMNGPGGNVPAVKKSMLPGVSLAPDVAAKGAAFLWSTKAIAGIVAQLEKATDLTTASDVLLLASTIPGDDVRHAIYSTFARLHAEGADQLNASGLFFDVHDPAMLAILKALPRSRPSRETAGTLDSWSSGTQSFVLALRDELKRTSANMKKYTDTLPVKLHKNATAEVSVMMQFPAGVGETAKGAIPALTQVYYTRTSFTPQRIHDGEDLIKHYESKASGFDRPDEAKGLRWIEGVKVLQNGHRRTMDVIIQKGGAAGANGQMGFAGGAESGYGGGAAGGSYSVEIIVVETVDPKNLSAATTTQVSAGQ